MKTVKKIYSDGDVSFVNGPTENFEMDGDGTFYFYKSHEKHYFGEGDELPEERDRLKEQLFYLHNLLIRNACIDDLRLLTKILRKYS